MNGRRILALRAGALGDTILALPALAALRRAVGPRGEISFAGREPFVRLAESPEHASRVHSVDRDPFRALFDSRVDDEELRSFLSPFDAVVSWSLLPLLREKLSGGRQVIEASPFPPEGVHAAEHLVHTLSPLGVPVSTPTTRLPVAETDRRTALLLLESFGLAPGQFVAIHPGSGSLKKNWPIEKFEALAKLIERNGRTLLWVEGEADSDVVSRLLRRAPAPVASNLSLPVLGALLSLAALYVGNDSGVSHLAAAVSTPTLALFGPTDPRSWAPPAATVVDFRDPPEQVWAKALERIKPR
jgi:heptosyltransferase-2